MTYGSPSPIILFSVLSALLSVMPSPGKIFFSMNSKVSLKLSTPSLMSQMIYLKRLFPFSNTSTILTRGRSFFTRSIVAGEIPSFSGAADRA